MGIVIRQSILSSIFSYLGVMIAYFNLLWLFPKALQQDEIGLLRIVQDIAILFVPFAQIGLGQSTVKFFPSFNNQVNRESGFLSFFIFASIITFSIFLLIVLLLKPFIIQWFDPAIVDFFHLVLALTFILALMGIVEAYSRSLLKIVFPNFVKEVLIRLFTSVIVLLYFIEVFSLTHLLYALIGTYALALGVLVLYLYLKGEWHFSFSFKFLNRKSLNKILQYSLYSMAGSSGIIILGKADTIMIGSLKGLSEAGVYSIMIYVAAVIEIPKRAIAQISMPLISRAFENVDLKEIKLLYRKASVNQLIIGLLILIGIWSSIQNLFHIMPNGDRYEYGKYVILIMGLGKLIDMTAGINGEIIIMSKYYKYNMIFIIIIGVFTIVSNYIFINLWGIYGAALASVLSFFVFNLIKLIFIGIKFKM
ncbi:MAG: oligosaccharide flippase family protein, partial [Bacteroidota bacterium]|nr:oligosaccharide flippase family protein [Bacteroidota bacterium]